jgi:hypothetical protein
MWFFRGRLLCAADGDGDGGGGGGAGGGSGDGGAPGGAGGGAGGDRSAALEAARNAAKAAGTYLVDDFREALDPDIQAHPSLGSIRDIKTLGKSYVNAQKLVGSDKVAKPTEKWTAAEWREWFKAGGAPDDPGKYDLKVDVKAPEGFQTPEKFQAGFKKAAHEAGLNATQAKTVYKFLQEQGIEAFNGYKAETGGRMQADTAKLKEEWGQAYQDKLKVASQLALAAGKEIPGLNAWLGQSGVGREPMVHRLLAWVAEKVGGEGKIGGDFNRSTLTPMEAKSLHDQILQDKTHPDNAAYWNKKDLRHAEVLAKVEKLREVMP